MVLGPILDRPGEDNDYQDIYIRRVAASFARVTGGRLPLDPIAPGRSAWLGDFALLTHRGDKLASLNYANRFALNLWECDWQDFAGMPSALTAPRQDRGPRDDLMQRVARDNFVSDYGGRRISAKGRLFEIRGATVWRLLEEDGTSFGVGAFFRDGSA